MFSAHSLMVLNICVKFHENIQVALNLWSRHENCNTQRAITQKVGKPELWLMCSAHCLMVFNICVKFHKNMSSGFKLMERTENC